MPTPNRDFLLGEIHALLTQSSDRRDPDLVLSDHALELVLRISRVVDDLSIDHEVLHALGWLHWYRYLGLPKGQSLQDLQAATTFLEPVYVLDAAAVPLKLREYYAESLPPNPVGLAEAGEQLVARAIVNGEDRLLEEAISTWRLAVAATPLDHPNYVTCLSNLGISLHIRFQRTDHLAYLYESIEFGRKALAATPSDDPRRGSRLSTLGNALHTQFERTGKWTNLKQAIDAFEASVTATPADHPARALVLANLGSSLQTKFEQTGLLADLDHAIETGQEALTATPSDGPHHATCLSSLGDMLRAKFEQTGQLTDLDQAIEMGQEAVTATPSDHPNYAAYLSRLGAALRTRFRRTGQLTDLDQAIDMAQVTLTATPPTHYDRGTRLSNLGSALLARFERTGRRTDLDRGVDALRAALAASPRNHPNHATQLSNLSTALSTRFKLTKDEADLDEAIETGKAAVAATQRDNPNHALFSTNLGIALGMKSRSTGQLADLDQKIELGEAAVAASRSDHPNRAVYLINLGSALHSKFEDTGARLDLNRAVGMFREAANIVTSSPAHRVLAARAWARGSVDARDWVEAVRGFSAALRLFGQVVPRGAGRTDQEHQLAQLAGISSEAVAACLQAADTHPENSALWRGRAVELFEQGRGVLYSQALDTRTDLADLTVVEPELAAQFNDLITRLDQTATHESIQVSCDPKMWLSERAADSRRRWQAAEALDRLLDQIRSVEGFRHFLLPQPVDQLLQVSSQGAIVLISVARVRSDALILTTDGVESVPLPGLTPDEVRKHLVTLLRAQGVAQDLNARTTERHVAEQALFGVLAWLWDQVTGPVLAHLGLTGAPTIGQPLPRIHWCPSGLLAFFPLHVAGHHMSGNDLETVAIRCISSFTPTIRALQRARAFGDLHVPEREQERLLVVAMPHTPQQKDLPGAIVEAGFLDGHLPGRVDFLGLPRHPEATRDSVLKELATHPWVHFSCHGATNLAHPSASYLLLTDHQENPLTVMDLAQARLPNSTLAFLSACSTARSGITLPDEPIHLAAACQLAGYQHVIATLWPIPDGDAALITKSFYRRLTTLDPATAIHAATRALRDNYPSQPSHWAAHIHTGP